MHNLIATKPFVYATRRLKAGEGFTVRSGKDARVLVALGKASRGAAIASRAEEPKHEKHEIDPTIRDLRAEYTALVGKPPFMGWDAAELKNRIAKAKAAKAKD